MEFYDDLMKEQYDNEFLFNQFEKYVDDYGIVGLSFLNLSLTMFLYYYEEE